MAEIQKLDSSSSSCEVVESEQRNMGTQRISVSDHINAYQYAAEKADSFVIDMNSLSPGSFNKDSTNVNSRITLQRNLSRKGSQRGGDRERKVNGNVSLHERDTVPTTCSPKAASLVGSSTLEKSATVGSTAQSTSPQIHHQIAITASNICSTPTESKCATRRNSFRRPSSWLLDPKRVLLLFATLSSMGTILLIYFTLTISRQNADEYVGDLQQ